MVACSAPEYQTGISGSARSRAGSADRNRVLDVRGKRKQWAWLGITAVAALALALGRVLSPFAAR
jgi:hypothetical protein